jgi:hypothetical protein
VVQSQPRQIVCETLSQKYLKNITKRAVRVAQVVQHLPGQHESLSSNLKTPAQKKEKEEVLLRKPQA